MQGGDDVAMYNLSLGYTNAQATAKNNDFDRLNIRFNTDVNLFKGFTTELDMAYVRNAYNLRDNGWAESYADRNISSPNVLGLAQSPFVDPYAYYVRYLGDNRLGLVHNDRVYTGMNYTEANNPLTFASQFGYPGLATPIGSSKTAKATTRTIKSKLSSCSTSLPSTRSTTTGR